MSKAYDPAARLESVVAGKYRLVRLIGEGGMGAVYDARHTFTKRRVAVKMLHTTVSASEEAVQRFVREAQTAAAIGHPGFVEVLDAGREADGSLYITMELLEGEDMMSALVGGRLTPHELLVVSEQVLAALGAAHARGFVHRDIKPENVFLARGEDGEVRAKILDLGIVKQMGAGEIAPELTQTGAILGTPYFMSPEQAKGVPIDGRADLWSVGAMLFDALSGNPPFVGDNYNVLIVAIITGSAPSLREARPDLPEEIIALVDRALRKDIRERYQTAAEMLEAVRACGPLLDGTAAPARAKRSAHPSVMATGSADAQAAAAMRTAVPPDWDALPSHPSLAIPPRSRRRGTIVAAAAGVLALAAVAAPQFFSSRAHPTASPSPPAHTAPLAGQTPSPSETHLAVAAPTAPPADPVAPAAPAQPAEPGSAASEPGATARTGGAPHATRIASAHPRAAGGSSSAHAPTASPVASTATAPAAAPSTEPSGGARSHRLAPVRTWVSD